MAGRSRVMYRTRAAWRLRSPGITAKLEERARWKEALEIEANRAYRSFLDDISREHYGLLRDVVNKLAVADCLQSLALRALQDGYVRPQFSDDDGGVLEIVEGRHPMVEALKQTPFVSNTVRMSPRHKVITGPNMGGKSCVVRMVALCAIVRCHPQLCKIAHLIPRAAKMAQIGSYVPAESMTIGTLDGILVRMGGKCFDAIKSTIDSLGYSFG